MEGHLSDLTEPQQRFLRTAASEEAKQQLARALTRVWLALVGLSLTVVGYGFYITFESGGLVRQLNQTSAQAQENAQQNQALMNIIRTDEVTAASTNATLVQLQIQLNRIESKVDK
jgi:uncharacterized protein HemX